MSLYDRIIHRVNNPMVDSLESCIVMNLNKLVLQKLKRKQTSRFSALIQFISMIFRVPFVTVEFLKTRGDPDNIYRGNLVDYKHCSWLV